MNKMTFSTFTKPSGFRLVPRAQGPGVCALALLRSVLASLLC